MWLCGQCSRAYNNNQYCDFCIQIYLDSGDYADTDGKEWIECESCKKWEHIECEIKEGYNKLPELIAQDSSTGFQYFCPNCRKKKGCSPPKSKPASKKCEQMLTLSSQIADDESNSQQEELEIPNFHKMSTIDSLMEKTSRSLLLDQQLSCIDQKANKKLRTAKNEPRVPGSQPITGKATPTLMSQPAVQRSS